MWIRGRFLFQQNLNNIIITFLNFSSFSTGKLMSQFPIEPSYAKALIASREFRCTSQVIDILSGLSVDSVFFISHDKREQVASAMKKFGKGREKTRV